MYGFHYKGKKEWYVFQYKGKKECTDSSIKVKRNVRIPEW